MAKALRTQYMSKPSGGKVVWTIGNAGALLQKEFFDAAVVPPDPDPGSRAAYILIKRRRR